MRGLVSSISHASVAVGAYIALAMAEVIMPNWVDWLIYVSILTVIEIVLYPLAKAGIKKLNKHIAKKYGQHVADKINETMNQAADQIKDEIKDKIKNKIDKK
jgi:uncharacterized protein involved in cysteine biosynthesis